jgi:hypothetical protein
VRVRGSSGERSYGSRVTVRVSFTSVPRFASEDRIEELLDAFDGLPNLVVRAEDDVVAVSFDVEASLGDGLVEAERVVGERLEKAGVTMPYLQASTSRLCGSARDVVSGGGDGRRDAEHD